ncbi:MAG TPA: hypothetical protein VMN78_02815 [Longimicrobiales bacterium]|nr:hypothetical protein [Longimicrobiales bacterium]
MMIPRPPARGAARLRAAAPGALLLVLAAFACVSTPPQPPMIDPVGCWYFDRDEAAAALNLPWGVRLSADTLTGWPRIEARVAATLNPEAEADHPFGYWMTVPDDSIEIGYPGGGGLVLRLARGEMAMAGTARAVGDVLTPGVEPAPLRPVRLTRAQCPAD